MVLEFFSVFAQWIISAIEIAGYPGLVGLMALESMIAPVPSELVMPFAGYLAAIGQFDLFIVILASVIGSIIGSVISYWLASRLGMQAISRFGKFVFLNEHHLEETSEWFRKHGEATILVGRFIPVVRHLISIPAGAGKMNFPRFVFFTTVGAAGWNGFLAYAGFYAGQNWETVYHLLDSISIAVGVILVIIVIGWFFFRKKKQV